MFNNYVLSARFHCFSWITEPTEPIIGADLALRGDLDYCNIIELE